MFLLHFVGRDAASVWAFCRRPFVPSVGRVSLNRLTRAYPNRFPDFLVFAGTNVKIAFLLRARPTSCVRRALFLKESRSERNDFSNRQPLVGKAFILQRDSFQRGVANDLNFKIVPNLDTTFIGLIE